ncbi:MAG: trigger factor [Candidatus Magasanikbacteria bacterium]
MPYTTKKLDNSQIELKITVTPKDYQKHLEKTAVKISERVAIKGFRSGKAPYEMVKNEVGEMKIMQEALEQIVQESFYNTVKEEGIETIGMPKINIEKMAPGNDIVFVAVVALLPKVKLADLDKIKVKKETKEVDEKQVDETVDAIRGMHAVEVIKHGKADGTDKIVLDMEMFFEKVPVEGGQAKDHQVYLSEKHYIPGFNEQVAGLKKDEEKEFSLDFPKEHFQKHLAGKKIDFKVKVKDVYERQLPEISDDLAKKLGQESMEKLREIIKSNLVQEAENKAEQKLEIEILENLIDKSEFEAIPEVLIDAEKQKMFYELKADLERRGVSIEDYLVSVKKTQEEMNEGFKEQAIKRAKASLVSRQVATENKIVVEDKELDEEIKVMEAMYVGNEEYLEKLKRPEVRDTIAMTLQNRKVMVWLKERVTE